VNDLVTQKPPQPPQLILGEETTLWGILPFLDFKVKPELSMNKHFVYTQQQSLTSMCSEPFAVPFPARSLSPSLTSTKVSFASPHSTLEISSTQQGRVIICTCSKHSGAKIVTVIVLLEGEDTSARNHCTTEPRKIAKLQPRWEDLIISWIFSNAELSPFGHLSVTSVWDLNPGENSLGELHPVFFCAIYAMCNNDPGKGPPKNA
jgi:hypothetical protein